MTAELGGRSMDYEVRLAAIPEQYVLGIRAVGPVSDLWERVRRVQAALSEAGIVAAGPPQARFFDRDYRPEETDYEVCLPVPPAADGSVPDALGEVRGDIVPAHHAFVTTHLGPHRLAGAAFAAIEARLAEVGYTVAGPATEVYVRGPLDSDDPGEYVTEIRVPYAR